MFRQQILTGRLCDVQRYRPWPCQPLANPCGWANRTRQASRDHQCKWPRPVHSFSIASCWETFKDRRLTTSCVQWYFGRIKTQEKKIQTGIAQLSLNIRYVAQCNKAKQTYASRSMQDRRVVYWYAWCNPSVIILEWHDGRITLTTRKFPSTSQAARMKSETSSDLENRTRAMSASHTFPSVSENHLPPSFESV